MKRRSPAAFMLILSAGCLHHAQPLAPANCDIADRIASLRCTLETDGEAAPGGPVLLRFTLQNTSGETLQIQTLDTPLASIDEDFLIVRRDGRPLPYQGPRIAANSKALTPVSYTTLAPGAAVTRTVDLAPGHPISEAGLYQIEFAGLLNDVYAAPVPQPHRQARDFRSAFVACNRAEVVITTPGGE